MNKTIFVISAAAILFTGCASITKGTSQTLAFKLDPKETRCNLTRIGDGELGSISSVNNTINVGKDKDDIVITCKADGYDDKTTRLVSSVSTAGVVGGAFLDLGITDMITGAMYEYQTDINIALDKTKVISATELPTTLNK
jgi:hypothetical protein